MTSSPTLAQIAAGDNINWKGQTGTVDSISSVTTHVGGTVTVVVIVDDGSDVDHTLTLNTADTVLSSYNINAANVSQATWSQTANP